VASGFSRTTASVASGFLGRRSRGVRGGEGGSRTISGFARILSTSKLTATHADLHG